MAKIYNDTTEKSVIFGSTIFGSTIFGSTVFKSTIFGSTIFGSTIFGSTIFGSTIFKLSIMIPMLMLMLITPSYAITNENIKWSDGNTFKLVPSDNIITEKDYTVRAVEFPSAVRGYRKVNGSVYTERPVTPFVKFNLYRDIINNADPIDTFTIGIGDEYVTSDQEMRITINDIPGSTSQDWVYEYYNPWTIIKIQKRSIPTLDININLKKSNGDNIDEGEGNIRPGDSIDAEIRIKNTGDDAIKNVDFSIGYGQLQLSNIGATEKLKDAIYQLNKDEKKLVNFSLIVPISLEEKEYEIWVNTTGYDIKDVVYYFNTSRIIKVKSGTESIYIEKRVSRNTSYLKEYVGVVLNIVNTGHVTIDNIQIHDTIPDRLIVVKDGAVQNYTEFSLNKSSIGPSESWTVGYSLKPEEPGIYILPQFDASFSIGEKNLSATSSEVGFRVFGPHVILTKSARDMGNGIIDVTVRSKNVGNGPTRAIIEDYILPNNTALISGEMKMTVSLDPDVEKVMSYTIRSYDTNISKLIWSPAAVTYYLDDWKFNTTSDEKYEEGRRFEKMRNLEGGTGAHVVILTPVVTATVYPEITVPQMQEEQKRVVATIPAKTSIRTQEKSIPGFVSYELILLYAIIILLKKKNY